MGTSWEDSTDKASIKPVSSLRSFFERTDSNDNSTARTNHLAPRPIGGFNREDCGSQLLARASLDVPRTPSPWSSPDAAIDPQHRGAQGPPVPNPRRPTSRILQRPLSTISLSAPQSPPFVLIQSPTSPPKVPRPGNVQRALDTSTSRSLTSVNTIPQSQRLTPKNLGQTPSLDSRIDLGNVQNNGAKASHLDRAVNEVPASSAARTLPPPFSRADKPKVPVKPRTIPKTANLEPQLSTTEEKVSPFSTPPSSDESPGPGAKDAVRAREIFSAHALPRRHGESHSPQQIVTSPAYRPRQIGEGLTPSRSKRFDSGKNDLKESKDSQTTEVDLPPELPPRRGQAQRVMITADADEGDGRPMKAAHIPMPDRYDKSKNNDGSLPKFLPPPKRAPIISPMIVPRPEDAAIAHKAGPFTRSVVPPEDGHVVEHEADVVSHPSTSADYPDIFSSNRRPPFIKDGVEEIGTNYDTRLVDICGRYVVTTGHLTRVWDVISGDMVLNIGHSDREARVTSLAFGPAATANQEGCNLWLGTNYGDIEEVHIPTKATLHLKTGAHDRREVVKIHRYQNSMWTLDDGGRLCVWHGDVNGLPDLDGDPVCHRVPRGHSFSLVVQGDLWLASNKDIRIFRPHIANDAAFSILQEPLSQPGAGAITSGAVIGCQLDRVYFGHADGKVTMYSTQDFTCLGVICVSAYKIGCLAGAGFHLWAGSSVGTLDVYDTRTQPWTTKKSWPAHHDPLLHILVDRSSLWKGGFLRVVSLGADNTLRFWDGTLEDDWLENDICNRDFEYCSFRELTALVISWNAGAATPNHLRHDKGDSHFFQDLLGADSSPDLLVFGFQELVDLEDKKLTAKTLLKGTKKKDPSEQEHMSRQYRAWRDYLVRCIEDTMPSHEPYHLLHISNMVGLFSCVFIKASQRSRVRNVNATEIKRGMGGLHGNKGALILRFIIDDSSVCLVNCHLAAGQTQTVNRNNDITAILDSSMLPSGRSSSLVSNAFVGGGDGSMVLDHEICILNGDLNYRIDTMGRETVVKAITANNLSKLLERDQLLVSRRRNPGFRVRAFRERPITFAPTYKYDIGSDRYDTSEKRRAPAWCDRILYRGDGKVKQTNYRRHDLRVSDHRPVSGRFKLRIKAISAEKRATAWIQSKARFEEARHILATEAKVEYLRDVLGVSPHEAKRLL